jgi:hypothetical protein
MYFGQISSKESERTRSSSSVQMRVFYLVFIVFAICLLLSPNLGYSKELNEGHAFINKKEEVINSFKKQKSELTVQKDKLEEEIRILEMDLQNLSAHEVEVPFSFLKGMFFLSNWVLTIILWFFPIMVLNHFLYLLLCEKKFFKAHRLLIIVIFACVELLFFLPLVSFAQSHPSVAKTEVVEVQDSFDKKLQEINNLVKMTPVERSIYILEHTEEKSVVLEKIEVKDPLLVPPEGRIWIESPEYYITLAALYRHVEKEEKAQKAINQLLAIRLTSHALQDKRYVPIYKNILSILIKNLQLVEAGKAAKQLTDIYVAQKDIKALTELSQFLSRNEMKESEKTAARALIYLYVQRNDVKGLVELSGFFAKNQMSECANEAMAKASGASESIQDRIFLARYLLSNSKSSEASIIIAEAIEDIRGIDDYLYMSRFLCEIGRKEKAARLLHTAKDKTRNLSDLLKISKASREMGFMSIAIDAIERAVHVDPEEANHYNLPSPHLLEASKFLPSDIDIGLPTYLGILQQLDDRMNSADQSYKAALVDELEAIIKSCGYKITGNINEFFYLKQLWEKVHPEKLRLLIPIYSYLQEDLLEKTREREKESIDELRNRIERLKAEKDDLIEQGKQIKSNRAKTYFNIVLLELRCLAIFLVLTIIIVGCIVKGVNHARSVSKFKFFAFYWKFQESLGWSACLSLVGIFVGIPLILFSQFMAIIQSIQQKAEQINLVEKSFMQKGE